MGDGDKLTSPKGKSVIKKIGDVLSPKNLKLKKNKNKPLDDFDVADDVDDIEEEALKDAPTPSATAKEDTDDSDNKSEDVQFFYEGRRTSLDSIDSGEFSLGSPFTAQFKEH